MKKIGKVYCAILAGGTGTRLNSPVPKQFLEVGGVPILIRSIRAMFADERIEELWIGANGDWYDLAINQIKQFIGKDERLHICRGGEDREGTLLNILDSIKNNNVINEDDIVLIHDAVRPFATKRIINDVINELHYCDVCNTVIPVNDTIIRSDDKKSVSGMPDRSVLFAGQSPQGFRIKTLIKAFESLDSETRKKLTETTKVCFVQDIPIHIVTGEFFNFKITTPYDMTLAEGVLRYKESAGIE
ncbi:MAG: 2-C-methyl-D-erythritol 4-phosphate cytidylyltransferase [Clostridia bacterium]|nr:2-C-methyl-D-erythritol 4-phosphate cytidylyltransferase [Clostridia bacterium]MBR0122205.1 2-C-methyl-D-erythritol 4-phosphate cytidylyltransferase [Clostridia bacterium]MBR3438812.1 2-C-methyl-D-erythritol 4-phosphate cytidylyltransferase [Clostridia bacterium]